MISVIVPCYHEQDALPLFYDAFQNVRGEISGEEIELILVDDGSRDATLEIMRRLAAEDASVRYISFSRNFGKEAAIYAGFQHCRGEYIVAMDADLQHPPALLKEMYHAITKEGYDSAAARRVGRNGESKLRALCAMRFYRAINRLSDTEVADGACDYRMMTRQFLDAVLSMGEYNRFSKGMFGWVGFKTKWIEFESSERVAGRSKWPFWKLMQYAMDGIACFSTRPLSWGVFIGGGIMAVGMVWLLLALLRGLLPGCSIVGWSAAAAALMFAIGVQITLGGIVGKYLSKVYMEVQKRPVYICRETNIRMEERAESRRGNGPFGEHA